MEHQFDDEPIDFIDPDKKYFYASYCESKGFTVLMKWCLLYHNDPNIVQRIADYLGEHPETINQKNYKGWTALMMSCRNSQTVSSDTIIKLLIGYGTDLDVQDDIGWTALMISCQKYNNGNSIVSIKLLIDNVKNNYGNTPLLLHVRRNPNIDIINLLLDYGADPHIKNYEGKTCIDCSYGEIKAGLVEKSYCSI
jgi:ankyrin repeat protein